MDSSVSLHLRDFSDESSIFFGTPTAPRRDDSALQVLRKEALDAGNGWDSEVL